MVTGGCHGNNQPQCGSVDTTDAAWLQHGQSFCLETINSQIFRGSDLTVELKPGGLETWRSGGLEVWRSGGLEAWRSGGLEDLPLGHPNMLAAAPFRVKEFVTLNHLL